MCAVFFDLDGTIIDPKAGMVSSLRAALELVGRVDLVNDRFDWIIGPPVRNSLTRILGDLATAEIALSHYRRAFFDERKMFDFSVYEGVIEAMHAIREDCDAIHICTMKPAAFAEPVVKSLNLELLVGEVFGPDLEGNVSSKDLLLTQACHKLEIDPAQCVVIGDRGSDMVAAHQVGMRSLGVTWGYGTAEELKLNCAGQLCDQPSDLAGMVGNVWQELVRCQTI